jgi:hypothetical protein
MLNHSGLDLFRRAKIIPYYLYRETVCLKLNYVSCTGSDEAGPHNRCGGADI